MRLHSINRAGCITIFASPIDSSNYWSDFSCPSVYFDLRERVYFTYDEYIGNSHDDSFQFNYHADTKNMILAILSEQEQKYRDRFPEPPTLLDKEFQNDWDRIRMSKTEKAYTESISSLSEAFRKKSSCFFESLNARRCLNQAIECLEACSEKEEITTQVNIQNKQPMIHFRDGESYDISIFEMGGTFWRFVQATPGETFSTGDCYVQVTPYRFYRRISLEDVEKAREQMEKQSQK
jgi:hypothetical protein